MENSNKKSKESTIGANASTASRAGARSLTSNPFLTSANVCRNQENILTALIAYSSMKQLRSFYRLTCSYATTLADAPFAAKGKPT
jgi:hypothetical protein